MKENKSITELKEGDVVRNGREYAVFISRSATESHGMFFRLTIPRHEDANQKDKFTHVPVAIVKNLALEGKGWCLAVRPIKILDDELDPLGMGNVSILGNFSKTTTYSARHLPSVLEQNTKGPIPLENRVGEPDWEPQEVIKKKKLPRRRNKPAGHGHTLPSVGRIVSVQNVTLHDACHWNLGGLSAEFEQEVHRILPESADFNLVDLFKAVSKMPSIFEETPEMMRLPIATAKEKGWLPSDNRMDTAYAKNGWMTLGDIVEVMHRLGESDVVWKNFGVQGMSEDRFQALCNFYADAVEVATQRQENITKVKGQISVALEDYTARAASGSLPEPDK